MYNEINWPSQKHEYISFFIDEAMVKAWLNHEFTIEELYLLCRRDDMGEEILYSEFADTFLLIAEHY